MPSETVVELKTQRPVHEQPQHSYTIPSSLYLDEKIYEQEKQNIFYCNWHYAGHASQLSKTGDYLTASVADESVFIVRCQDETLRGFYNVCRHRAHQLLEGSGKPVGPKRRAIDWARLRCADFAEANAVELAPPRNDAVAPITTIEPLARAFMGGITCWLATSRPNVLVRHDDFIPSTVVSSTLFHSPDPAL